MCQQSNPTPLWLDVMLVALASIGITTIAAVVFMFAVGGL